MITVEIILIIIGIIFLIGSFMVRDKLSAKDVENIAQLSEDELKIIVNKQLKKAQSAIETNIEDAIEESKEMTVRAMEKESNEKILSISEFSDTVMESMNKTHNEIMFLYSMLNDKHKDLSEFAGRLQELADRVSRMDLNIEREVQTQQPVVEPVVVHEEKDENDAFATFVAQQQTSNLNVMNNNDSILTLHKRGMTDIDIARELGLGLGEVKLVIDLFEKGRPDEI